MSDVSENLPIIVLYKNHFSININKTKNKHTTLFIRSLQIILTKCSNKLRLVIYT